MTNLRRQVLDLLRKENVQCDGTINDLSVAIEKILIDYIIDDWSTDDCK